ncbi:FAD-dependent oxidoreductase [Faunimonas sp. B44]|uniref:FAD-dependent oxidoreductase n=1 Tax=Faunimonas sp. B44 TaxID=3461493 RepID=UPI0040443825
MSADECNGIETTTCLVAGGGPAGMMLGFLLARAGVDVIVCEKHADFLRDFRGDTIHPSTLEVMKELGLLEHFLERPHAETRRLAAWVGDEEVVVADFAHLPTTCRFVAFMPQWEFLDFLATEGRRYPGFRLMMETKVTGLIEEEGRVTGARVEGPDGPLAIRASLVVGADGRHSNIRALAGLTPVDLGAPMDVLWMRLSRRPDDPELSLGRIDAGHMVVLINRGDYWQCADVIPKGTYDSLRREGLDAFRRTLAALVPFLKDRVEEIASWDEVKLLTVAVDRLERWWRPGLLCIGDAAHAMSPIGGVGINLAVQDAIAAANILAEPLRGGTLADSDLAAVEKRRIWPTRATQRLQVLLQNRVIAPTLARRERVAVPPPLRLLARFPVLRRIPARLIGMGFRPEHVRTAERMPA